MRGALAGVAAAAVWAAAEPPARRLFGTEYGDVRLLGRFVTRSGLAGPVGLAAHLVNGAVFGAAFERLGGHGPTRAIVAAQVENALLWPGLVVVDRIHPDRRSGALPPLLTNSRVLAQEIAVHALFGAVLGLLVRRRAEG